MKITLCTKVTNDLTLEETAAVAAESGYWGLEIFGFEEHLPPTTPLKRVEELARLLDDLGLGVNVLATYVGPYDAASDEETQQHLEDTRTYCRFADILGADYVRQGTGRVSPPDATDEQWERTAQGLRAAAEVCAEFGKSIVLETHANQLVETADSTLKLIGMVDRPNVKVTWDPSNHHCGGFDYGPTAAHKLAEFIVNVHVKDVANDRTQTLLGEGDVDWASVMRGLEEIGYDGHIGVECHAAKTEQMGGAEIVAIEIATLRKFLEEGPPAK